MKVFGQQGTSAVKNQMQQIHGRKVFGRKTQAGWAKEKRQTYWNTLFFLKRNHMDLSNNVGVWTGGRSLVSSTLYWQSLGLIQHNLYWNTATYRDDCCVKIIMKSDKKYHGEKILLISLKLY